MRGSRDETAAVADVAGCNFLLVEGPLGGRLKAAAAAARAPWLLFLRPGTVLDAPWIGERPAASSSGRGADPRAAVFRRAAPAQSGAREALSLFAAALGAQTAAGTGPDHLASNFTGRSAAIPNTAADPEAELLRRIGRRRIVTLSTAAFHVG